MRIFRVLEIVLPVVVLLGLGFFSNKKQIVTREGAGGIKSFVMNFTLPMVAFHSLYREALDAGVLLYLGVILLCCFAGYVLGRLAARLLRTNPLLPYLTCTFENSMLGYPLYVLLFGAENLSHMVILNLSHVVFVYSVAMPLANIQSGMPRTGTLKRIFTTPAFVGVLVGVFFAATGLGRALDATAIGPAVASVAEFISRPTAGAILFVAGYDIILSRAYLKDAAVAAAARLCIMALLLFGALGLLGLLIEIPEYRRYAFIMMFILPCTFVTPMFVKKQEDISYIATSNSFYMLLTICMFTIFAAVVA